MLVKIKKIFILLCLLKFTSLMALQKPIQQMFLTGIVFSIVHRHLFYCLFYITEMCSKVCLYK